MTQGQANLREETIMQKKAKVADVAMNAAFLAGLVLAVISTAALILTKLS
ncbi:hypothetical protein IT570_04575 [Candidatus Sumerlaeota bacterium]|nr:hypothetical protein [Candidatus Sumerlaeota bacterium]